MILKAISCDMKKASQGITKNGAESKQLGIGYGTARRYVKVLEQE